MRDATSLNKVEEDGWGMLFQTITLGLHVHTHTHVYPYTCKSIYTHTHTHMKIDKEKESHRCQNKAKPTLVTFLVAVTKYITRKEGNVGSQSKGYRTPQWGRHGGESVKQLGHAASTVRKQRGANAGADSASSFPLLTYSRTPGHGALPTLKGESTFVCIIYFYFMFTCVFPV